MACETDLLSTQRLRSRRKESGVCSVKPLSQTKVAFDSIFGDQSLSVTLSYGKAVFN